MEKNSIKVLQNPKKLKLRETKSTINTLKVPIAKYISLNHTHIESSSNKSITQKKNNKNPKQSVHLATKPQTKKIEQKIIILLFSQPALA